VGKQNYGKGLALKSINLGDGTGLLISDQKYYTPSGANFEGSGLIPDFLAEAPDISVVPPGTVDVANDPQLKKAAEVLRSSNK
jgi:carboxyl-terminal processing protease